MDNVVKLPLGASSNIGCERCAGQWFTTTVVLDRDYKVAAHSLMIKCLDCKHTQMWAS